ncbi:MAG: hypothetical protein LBP64_03125, partial [Tannerella sp.]|nr:hypothetical protein [Tannerella sp.]
MKEISRKNFLRVCGSIVAGGAVAGMSGTLLKRRAGQAGFVAPAGLTPQPKDTFTSPYRRVASFETGGAVQALAQHGGTVYVAAAGKVAALDARGKLLRTFPVRDETVRDMAVDGDAVYLLHPAKVSVYATNGALLRAWEACSELSNYCALALSDDFVFVTDMDNKNICKYTRDGR